MTFQASLRTSLLGRRQAVKAPGFDPGIVMRDSKLMIFGGNANPKLAQSIASYLQQPLGKVHLSRFSDGETTVEILENVRGGDVFIVQPVCVPTNDNLMDLLLGKIAGFVRLVSRFRPSSWPT